MKRNKVTRKMKQATETDQGGLAKRGHAINRLIEVGKQFGKPEKLDRHRLAKLSNDELLKLMEEEAGNLRLIAKEKELKTEAIEARRQLASPGRRPHDRHYVAKVSIWFKPFQQVIRESPYVPKDRSTMALSPSEALRRLNTAHRTYEALAAKATSVVKTGGRLPVEEGRRMAAALLERQELAQYLRGLK